MYAVEVTEFVETFVLGGGGWEDESGYRTFDVQIYDSIHDAWRFASRMNGRGAVNASYTVRELEEWESQFYAMLSME